MKLRNANQSIVKQLIGIYCHTTDLNSAEESLYISKLKFIQRMEKN